MCVASSSTSIHRVINSIHHIWEYNLLVLRCIICFYFSTIVTNYTQTDTLSRTHTRQPRRDKTYKRALSVCVHVATITLWSRSKKDKTVFCPNRKKTYFISQHTIPLNMWIRSVRMCESGYSASLFVTL